MAKRSLPFLLLPALFAGSTAMATGLPSEGSVDVSLCFGGPMHVIAVTPAERFGTYTVKGGTQASIPAFDSMASECDGVFEVRAGTTRTKGYCVYRDTTGDMIYGTDAIHADGSYVWSYLGGTGKFQGISGGGTVERTGTLAPGEGRMRGCRRLSGHYKLG